MPSVSANEVLDEALPPEVRDLIEARFWSPIDENASLEALHDDPLFLASPADHPALFADHGTVHVRDIANAVVALGELADGLLLPRRSSERHRFRVAYAVLVTYLHDIGMCEMTAEGRRVHAVYAAHVVFSEQMDDIVELLVGARGPVIARLEEVDRTSPLGVPIEVALRELIALTMAHSKSTVPAPLLNDRPALRRLVQRGLFTAGAGTGSSSATGRYRSPMEQSYAWLDSADSSHVQLAEDVVDALRLLRAADALRQRGTSLRTSAGYEVFIEQATGQAVYALRSADNGHLYLLRSNDLKSAGEANIRVAAISPNGHLRIGFQRGAYACASARRRAVECTAAVVADIQADVLPAFSDTWRAGVSAPDGDAMMLVQLERPDDEPSFANDVARALVEAEPSLGGRVAVVADLAGADTAESDLYHRGIPVLARSDEAGRVLSELRAHGTNVDDLDEDEAFSDVRRVTVEPGESLMRRGSPPAFVYIATGPGLRVLPGGGYRAVSTGVWIPLGVTGVVRRAERNSDVVAEQPVDVLMIPGELFTRAWFRPYDSVELRAVLSGG